MKADLSQFLMYRDLDDGRLLAVVPLLFGQASLTIGPGGDNYDGGFSDCWWYDSVVDAMLVCLFWNIEKNPEPPGWVYHPFTRRRRPCADPAAEFIDED